MTGTHEGSGGPRPGEEGSGEPYSSWASDPLLGRSPAPEEARPE